jgi:hypothetical protein
MHIFYEPLFKQNKWMHDLELYSKMYSENNLNLNLFILRCQIMLSKNYILNKSNLICLQICFGINTQSLKNDSLQCGFKTSLNLWYYYIGYITHLISFGWIEKNKNKNSNPKPQKMATSNDFISKN